MYCDLLSQYIKVQKLFKGGNYLQGYCILVIGIKVISRVLFMLVVVSLLRLLPSIIVGHAAQAPRQPYNDR